MLFGREFEVEANDLSLQIASLAMTMVEPAEVRPPAATFTAGALAGKLVRPRSPRRKSGSAVRRPRRERSRRAGALRLVMVSRDIHCAHHGDRVCRFARDSALEGGSHVANSSLFSPKFRENKGISSIWSSVASQRGPKRPSTQCLTSQFPTHPNREFFAALQGIKSGDQGNFFPHQGIRSRPTFWHLL